LKSTLGHDGPAVTTERLTVDWPVLLFEVSVARHVSDRAPALGGVYV
jgi:hypothetical protein